MPGDARLRSLPQVDKLLREEPLVAVLTRHPRSLVVGAVRAVLSEERAARREGRRATDAGELARRAAVRAAEASRPTIRRVINGTGIVLHTNLGRAPFADAAQRAVAAVASGYSSLEYDLASGRRGQRGTGIERALVRLTGAEGALAVNNGAAAILLALSAVAAGRKVLVSRGELVEIGGSFRVPEIMEKSGAGLVEVGATNRTHLRDYEKALERHGREVGAILRVHPSNFRVEGFTARPTTRELAAVAHRRRLPLIEDLGSGALVEFESFGLAHEPTVAESLAAGADLVTCSGDKLLGGSQAGLVLGGSRWVERCRKDPLARALRMDKLALAALEATLHLYADVERARRELPVLAMLAVRPEALEARAARLAQELAARVPGLEVVVAHGSGEVGGGSLPAERLPGPVLEIAHPQHAAAALEALARTAEPPVIGTVKAGRFRLDPRTMTDTELGMAATALAKVW